MRFEQKKGRGARRQYCPEHSKERKRDKDRARPKGGHVPKDYYQCCLDAKAANPRRRICDQHKQWRAWYRLDLAEGTEQRAEDNDDNLADIVWSQRFRLTFNHPDDYLIPDPELEWTLAGVKSGYDAKGERQARGYLAAAPDRERKAASANMPKPQDVGYWQKVCAERRRWHKSKEFRYPPQMNRGDGWLRELEPI